MLLGLGWLLVCRSLAAADPADVEPPRIVAAYREGFAFRFQLLDPTGIRAAVQFSWNLPEWWPSALASGTPLFGRYCPSKTNEFFQVWTSWSSALFRVRCIPSAGEGRLVFGNSPDLIGAMVPRFLF